MPKFRLIVGEADFTLTLVKAGFLTELRGDMRIGDWVLSILTKRIISILKVLTNAKLQV